MARLFKQTRWRLSHPLLLHAAGLLVVLAVLWLDTAAALVARVPPPPTDASVDLLGPSLKSLLVLVVWIPIALWTRHLSAKLESLERFMRVCSWCRRVEYKGEWMPFEEFMAQGFDTPTTHGICRSCMNEQRRAVNSHPT